MSLVLLITVMSAFALNQLLKCIITSMQKKRIAWRSLIDNGGMPSSHAAFAAALTTAVIIQEGFLSTIALVTLGMSLIVIRDAFGIRHAVDEVIYNLGLVLGDSAKKTHAKKIRTPTGHTPLQVLAGIICGILGAILSYALAARFLLA